MRKLASVQPIRDVRPIEDADFIEEVVVGGWHTITKKGDFQPGDLGIFLEIDSLLNPDLGWVQEHVPFMEPRKWRVKTLRMRGVLSQGLVLPLSVLDSIGTLEPISNGNLFNYQDSKVFLMEDVELTEALGIVKYDPPEVSGGSGFNSGKSKGDFPSYLVPKTDENRIQSSLRCLEELSGLPYYISIKCNGTSATFVYVDEDDFAVCSRNNITAEDDNCVYWKVAKQYNLKEKIKNFTWNGKPKRISIQGECCGPSIQSNELGLTDHDLFIFNVYDVDERCYFGFDDFISICEQLELKTVPILEEGDNFDYNLDCLLEMARGAYPLSGKHQEGIVIRPKIEKYSAKLKGRLSFKCINNDSLEEAKNKKKKK